MRKLFYSLLIFLFCVCAYAQVILLQDIECSTTGSKIGDEHIESYPGVLSSSVCVKIENEISCNFTDSEGKIINTDTKFLIVFDDNKSLGYWRNADGFNIFMMLNYAAGRYSMGMTAPSFKHAVLMTKFCVGNILKH